MAEGWGLWGDIYDKIPEVVPMSDKAIFSKMDLLLTKAELSTMLVDICDNVLSLFPIIPLWPLIGSRSNFSSLVCFACDGNRSCPYLFMLLGFCHILSPHPVEEWSNRVTWWAPDGLLRSPHQVTRAQMPGTTLVEFICCPSLAQVKVTAAGVHAQHFFPYRFA